jgi:hypothetical protein
MTEPIAKPDHYLAMSNNAASNLSSFLASRKTPRKRFFRRAFVFRDRHWVNPTTITLTNTPYGMAGPVSMLHNLYKQKMNFGSLGLGIFQTTQPANGNGRGNSKYKDKDFESVCLLDLETFTTNYCDAESLANALEKECDEMIAEWSADNGTRDKMGSRIPVERTFTMAKYAWENKNKKEESEYDTQLSK